MSPDAFSNLQLLDRQLGRSESLQVRITQLFDFQKADPHQVGKLCLEHRDVRFRQLDCLHMRNNYQQIPHSLLPMLLII